ncbi:MAG: helix-hairpin-helix domain-containing protein [Desulfobacterota bacterium]|nr:helix-hairpin-helix domain-containing protein [Thermodesulfobacteriota bacterium]
MIRYIAGKILKAQNGILVVCAGGIGFEILLPDIVWRDVAQKGEQCDIELYISYQQTQQQPKPVLIGFNTQIELEFFEQLITVKDIGPITAAKCLTLPIPVIAQAIEDRDVATVMKLKGIGRRKADMIISELNGKVGKYALLKKAPAQPVVEQYDIKKQVVDVLVKQLGHSRSEAVAMVEKALERKPDTETPEELFEEVYRGTKA